MRWLHFLALALVLLAMPSIAILASGPRIWSMAVTEASGMTAMTHIDSALWVVNDSGGTPQLHAIGPSGRLIRSVDVLNGWNRDWEALAKGPCAGWLPDPSATAPETCLFIGNLGANGMIKAPVTLIIVPEPDGDQTSVRPLRIILVRYPGRTPDVEAIAFAGNGPLLLFAKWRDGRPATPVYQLAPPGPGAVQIDRMVDQIATLPVTDTRGNQTGPFTDASASPDGQRLYVRDYGRLYQVLPDKAADLTGPLKLVPIASRPVIQGEAFTVSSDGRSLTLTSEGPLAPIVTQAIETP